MSEDSAVKTDEKSHRDSNPAEQTAITTETDFTSEKKNEPTIATETPKQELVSEEKVSTPKSSNATKEATPVKEKTPPSQPASVKKPRRRLAANFNL